MWEYAKSGGFTIVPQNADFAEMAALYGPLPMLIWLRQHTNGLFELV